MKSKILLLFLATTMIFSCSNDDNNETETETSSIVGTWVATELIIDDATSSDYEKNLRDGLNVLTANACYVVTITFNEDLTVVVENSVDYIELVGLDIPCPTERDRDDSTYTYDGTTLTILDGTGTPVSAEATVQANTLTVDAVGLNISDLIIGGELIFTRQ